MTRTASPYDAVLTAPFGSIGIRMRGGALARVDLDPRSLPPAAGAGDAALAAACALERYLHDPASLPALELEMDGTPFQRRVWRALRSIPCGATLTYGELARRLGTSARAVGGACRENPLPIVVPCHRVVAAGRAGGFMGRREGRALGIKSWLLRHEARTGTDERNGQG